MIVDRRKDSYDELMMLARDTRVSRNRRARWTTGVVTSAVIGSGVFVAASSEHMNMLDQARQQAESEADSLRTQLVAAEAERDLLKLNLLWFQDAADQMEIGDQFQKLFEELGPINLHLYSGEGDSRASSTSTDVIWVVDGSRRFPMTHNDILWVPEGQFWVQLMDTRTGPDDVTTKPESIGIHRDASPGNEESRQVASKNFSGDGDFIEIKVGNRANRGNADCVRLTWRRDSDKPGFSDPRYIDMEVYFYPNLACPPRP